MNILHVFKTYLPDTIGGIEQVVHTITTEGLKHDIASTVFSLSRNPLANSIPIDGVETIKAKLNFEIASTGFSFAALPTFQKLADSADLIHYHYPWPVMDLLHLFGAKGKPAVITYHSDIVQQNWLEHLYAPVRRQFFAQVDTIVTTSPKYHLGSKFLGSLNRAPVIIPIGIDPEAFANPDPARSDYWTSLFGQPFFAFVGVLRYYKGLDVLIKASKQTGIPVVIAGSGPMAAKLSNLAVSIGADKVFFAGQVSTSDKVALLHASMAFAFPSHLRSEAFGVSLLEAAACCKPMISCEIGTGTSFANQHGETGIVVKANDEAAFAQAMLLMAGQPEQTRQMGQRAFERLAEKFSAKTMAKSYFELYRQILNKRSSVSLHVQGTTFH